jgi:hypothetical protein
MVIIIWLGFDFKKQILFVELLISRDTVILRRVNQKLKMDW